VITLLDVSSYTGDIVVPSPNHDVRKAPAIEGIVLHATADAGDEGPSVSWLRSPKSRVSCHLLVSRSGRATRLVGDRQRAWHAGVSWWRGTSDVNSITLGIEIANRNDGEPFTDAQYQRVADIVAHYCRQGLSLDDVVSHEEVSEGRKCDPLGWDWERFRQLVLDQLWPMEVLPLPRSTVPDYEEGPVIETVPVAATTKPKPILYSRTVWLNALTVIAAAAMLIADALDLLHRMGIYPPDEVIKWALFAIGMVNIILRLHTTGPITCSLDGSCSPEIQTPCPHEPSVKPKDERLHARDQVAFAVSSSRS
jgi:hypothetical protein